MTMLIIELEVSSPRGEGILLVLVLLELNLEKCFQLNITSMNGFRTFTFSSKVGKV